MRKLGKVIFSLLIFLGFGLSVKAASATIGISTNTSRVVVGSNVRVTVTISASQPLGAWEYTLVSDTNMFSLVGYDVNQHYIGYANNNNTKSVSYNYTFKAKKAGTAKFYITGGDVIDFDYASMDVVNGSRSVTVITEKQLQESYSKNNNLSSLSVEGFDLTPEFKQDNLEYSVTLPPETTTITINATKADNTASVSGTGEKEVSLGLNKFEIIVTAQNGSQKTYIINATVQELEPIEVQVDGKTYTVVRQAEVLDTPNTFIPTTVFIDGKEVPALHSDITNITLVGLKNEDGEIALYNFDVNANVYVLYQEVKSNSFNVVPQIYDKELDGFIKKEVEINGIKVNAFVRDNNDEFYIIYGTNTESGETQLYKYDTKENTLQRYVEEDILSNKAYKNFLVVMALFGGGLLLSFIINLSLLSKNKKLKKRILNHLEKKNIFTEEVKSLEEIKALEEEKEKDKEVKTTKKEKKPKKETKEVDKENIKEKEEKEEEVKDKEKKEEIGEPKKVEEVSEETAEYILDEKLAKKRKKKKKASSEN